MNFDFGPSHEKISRAKYKYSQILNLLKDWVSSGSFSVDTRVIGSRAHLVVKTESFPAEEMAWEYVEGVGHLRSSLDKMIVEIIEKNGRGGSNAKFPFGGADPAGIVQAFPSPSHINLKNKMLDDQWRKILDLKPYPGGDDILWSVNLIANFDKHKKGLVQVVASKIVDEIAITGGKFVGDGTDVGISMDGDEDVYIGASESLVFSYAYSPGSVPPQINMQLIFSALIKEIPEHINNNLLLLFKNQIRAVNRVVSSFERDAPSK